MGKLAAAAKAATKAAATNEKENEDLAGILAGWDISALGNSANDRTARSRSPGEGKRTRTPGQNRSRPSRASSSSASSSNIKVEKPDPDEQRRMIAKLHYLKKTGKSQAFDEYNSHDLDGKRAWFHQVYKRDPQLSKYSTVGQTKSTFRTLLFVLDVGMCFYIF